MYDGKFILPTRENLWLFLSNERREALYSDTLLPLQCRGKHDDSEEADCGCAEKP